MYSTCLHCNRSLASNPVLETLPVGRRIAFDAAVGRLWVVCHKCGKWNLVPFDTRLETIEACERLFRETKTRYSTGKIGLARHASGLELVRIGEAQRPEFAAWRYGESYRLRRRNHLVWVGAGTAGVLTVLSGVAGIALATGFGAIGAQVLFHLTGPVSRWLANRKLGFLSIDPDQGRPARVGPEQFARAMITWERDEPSFEIPIVSRLSAGSTSYLQWSGADLRSNGRRVLGGLNVLHGSRRQLQDASDLLGQHHGDLSGWLRDVTERDAKVGRPNASWRFPGSADAERCRALTRPYLRPAFLPPHERLALEMWMNEDIERIWLEGELRLLEREWREAERLARIADDLALEAAGVGGQSTTE